MEKTLVEISNTAREQLKIRIQPNGLVASHALLYPALLVGFAPATQAAVVKVTGSPVSVTNDDTSVPWNITGALTTVPYFFDDDGCFSTPSDSFALASNGVSFLMDNTYTSGIANIIPITSAMTVDSSGTFNIINCYCNGLFDCSGIVWYDTFGLFAPIGDFSGTLGFRFDNNGTINYGIANFSVTNCDGSVPPTCTFTITEWAYENTGAGISGNALNAPSPVTASASSLLSTSLLSLALGATGLGLRRRRRDLTVTRH